MGKRWLFVVWLVMGTGWRCLANTGGPLELPNLFPPYWGVLTFQPRSPFLSEGFSFSGIYSVTAQEGRNEVTGWQAVMDMEVFYLQTRYTYALNERSFVEARLPIFYAYGGFMDNFLIQYHNFLGLPGGGREKMPRNKFRFWVAGNGKTIASYTGRGPAPGDLSLSYLYSRNFSPRTALALEAGVELPTGRVSSGYSNDSVDAKIALHYQKNFRRTSLYSGLGYLIPGDFGNVNPISLNPFWAYTLAGEWFQTPKTHWLIQLNWMSNPFPTTGLKILDKTGAEFVMGYRRNFKRQEWTLGFTEDFLTLQSPDINFVATLRWK